MATMKQVMSTSKKYNLGNLTVVLPSYECNKKCPFCIAKNNRKFNGKSMDFDGLKIKLDEVRRNNIHFSRIVLSGNGEPSLYSLEDLQRFISIINGYQDVFDCLRVHSSGNIFSESEKFELFNSQDFDVEYDVLRVAVDSEVDMKVLGYNVDYLQTEAFKRARKIKMDLGLTTYLNIDSLPEDLEELTIRYPNIDLIRFKNLMTGDHTDSKEARWAKSTRLSRDEFMRFGEALMEHCGPCLADELKLKSGIDIKIENTGNYEKDIVYSEGEIMDYKEKQLNVSALVSMANDTTIDSSRKIDYDDNSEHGGRY